MELSPRTLPLRLPSTAREGAQLRVRQARTQADLRAALRLRGRMFRNAAPGRPGSGGDDRDSFDSRSLHLLVEETVSGRLLGCCRLLLHSCGREILGGYAARHYGLARLARHPGPMAELGRLCIDPAGPGPEVARLIVGAVAGIVLRHHIGWLFGCSSLPGVEPGRWHDTLALLASRHGPPARWRPEPVAAQALPLPPPEGADLRAGLRAMPAPLRSYLALGAWVSDHAVVDRDLGTLHLFTALEISAVAPRRAAFLSRSPEAPPA